MKGEVVCMQHTSKWGRQSTPTLRSYSLDPGERVHHLDPGRPLGQGLLGLLYDLCLERAMCSILYKEMAQKVHIIIIIIIIRRGEKEILWLCHTAWLYAHKRSDILFLTL